MNAASALTTTALNAVVKQELINGDYVAVDPSLFPSDVPQALRVYEDQFCVVAVAVYETWSELFSKWTEAQSHVVSLMSKYFFSGESKAWDGYLVLLTPDECPKDGRAELQAIQYHMARLRKLVATGDRLKTVQDVRSFLSPLLPMVAETRTEATDPADSVLLDLLEKGGLTREQSRGLLKAHLENRPLMTAFREEGGESNED